MTAVLRIDDKWSVEYDPEDNDRPLRQFRYGEEVDIYPPKEWFNDTTAMFYALLEARTATKEKIDALEAIFWRRGVYGDRSECRRLATEVLAALGMSEPK